MIKPRFWPFIPSPLRGALKHRGFPGFSSKVMLINASQKFKPLKKSRGAKRKAIDEASRLDIVATLTRYADNDYARVFDKEFFYFNKQAIRLTKVDENGKSLAQQLQEEQKSLKLKALKLSTGEYTLTEFAISAYDTERYNSLKDYFVTSLKPLLAALDYKEQPLRIETEDDYFITQLEEQLAGVSESIKNALIEKRRAYANNKNVYSLLMQYAAGFGKSNIIGWSALQLKDLRRNGGRILFPRNREHGR